jgi:hypothetical protein
MDDIEQAVALKKRNIKKPQFGSKNESTFDWKFEEIKAETSYLLASHSPDLSSNSGLQRTGRWTEEETVFVDFFLEAFDKGKLPIPDGVVLKDFLCDLLLCKSSRLTKKLKNAKLSVRSYNLKSPSSASPSLDVGLMCTLQESFLRSISPESSKLELRFAMNKMWKSHFSNLCLQIGCEMLDASEWLTGLENMEQLASQTEQKIRKARRCRMGQAMKIDTRVTGRGVIFAGIPAMPPDSSNSNWPEETQSWKRRKTDDGMGSSANLTSITDSSSMLSESSLSQDGSESDFVSSMNGKDGAKGPANACVTSDDVAELLEALHETGGPTLEIKHNQTRQNCESSFLGGIATYMESHNLPFEHADIFVPSFPAKGEDGEIRLFYAGHVTRSDLDSRVFSLAHEYGEYSIDFSYAPDVGLPGRVYASGEPSWEEGVDEADPEFFDRVEGAKLCGIKSGLGIPLTTAAAGRIVVSLYSTQPLRNDPVLAQKIMSDLTMFAPKPKWQLVVDMDDVNTIPTVSSGPFPVCCISDEVHYEHSPNMVTSKLVLSERNNDEEHIIATLLGEHMPLYQVSGERIGSSYEQSARIEDFISLRLLLLRSSEKRSEDENEMLDVIGNSYRGYKHRDDKDVAFLLANDWRFLHATTQCKKLVVQPCDELQMDGIEIPVVNTSSTVGPPAAMPSTLPIIG